MNNYDFIEIGGMVWWDDPADETSGIYEVVDIHCPEDEGIEDDTVILIASDYSEAEVFARELSQA